MDDWNWDINDAPSEHLLFYGTTRHDIDVIFTGWKARNGSTYSDNSQFCEVKAWMSLDGLKAKLEGETDDR